MVGARLGVAIRLLMSWDVSVRKILGSVELMGGLLVIIGGDHQPQLPQLALTNIMSGHSTTACGLFGRCETAMLVMITEGTKMCAEVLTRSTVDEDNRKKARSTMTVLSSLNSDPILDAAQGVSCLLLI